MKTILFSLFYSLLVVQSFAQFENDLGISEPRFQEVWEYEEGGNFRDLEYSIYPISQLREFHLNAKAINFGVLTQNNVILQVEINGPQSFNLILTSNPVNIAPGFANVFEISPWMPPLQVGTYTVDFSIISDDEDDYLENNVMQRTFKISQDQVFVYPNYADFYARDLNARDGSFVDFAADYKIGNAFYIESPATLQGIGAALAQGSVVGTAFNFELLTFPGLEYIGETTLTFVSPNNINVIGGNTYTWQAMESPISLIAGMNYVVVLNHFGGQDDVIVATSGYSPDYSSFYFRGDEVTWYYTNETPMVRMALGWASSTYGCTDPLALNYNPSANIDDGSCEYPNPLECEVAYEMFPDTIGSDVIWVVLDYSSAGNTAFHWDFGDGNESSETYPSHTYAEDGDYLVCVTINVTDDLGVELCTEVFCDTISSDFLSGLVERPIEGHRQNGFTINVVNPTWLSVSETEINNSFTFFPNPTTGLLNVLYNGSSSAKPTIQFYDISGRLLQSETIPVLNQGQQLVFDISYLPAGVYFVSIESASGRETHKLMKQ